MGDNIDELSVRKAVKERYAELARGGSPCCSGNDYAEYIGYSLEEVSKLPDEVTAVSAGCGNPTAIADLKPGQTVLDLGSGGGIDVFLAAEAIGKSG
ncbi:MAG TPA: arsenite S-adenosylmethyltransferase, partial [Methanocella sp.]|nr:arsenite S-adenosylmethyltransferase [Methanocella sp.]